MTEEISKKIQFRTKNPKQLEAASYWIDQETEELLYGGAKYGGKSFLGASLIFGDALIYPDTHYFIARQELTDLHAFTLPSIHEVFQKWGLKFSDYVSYNGQTHIFTLYNGSTVHFIACKATPSDPLYERFGSMQMTRGWIEEGGEVVESAKANLALSIGRWKNDVYGLKKKLLITANPKKGWMKREFIEPWRRDELPVEKKFVQAFATDNVHGDTNYIKSLEQEKDKVRKQRLWEGNWDYDEDNDSLVTDNALTDAFSNAIVKDGQKYMTVDVARQGKDKTVIGFWEGLELYRVEQYEKQATSETEQKIKDLAVIEHVPYSNIMIDEDGVGGGVVDHLFGVKGFVANSTPLPTTSEIRDRFSKIENFLIPKRKFANLKSQCGWKLAELINEHKIAFKVSDFRDIILEELSSLLRKKDVDSDGKNTLKPKDKVKEDLGRSPDVGDMLIFRVWFELKKIATQEDPVQDNNTQRIQRERVEINRARVSMNSSK